MALDDYLESEVAIAVAATAAVLSPRARGIVRKGAVYGLAGVLMAADAIGSFAGGIARGAAGVTGTAPTQEGATPGVGAAHNEETAIEVDVPVRVAYDQWTQFELFPHFMEGVAEVRQIDDTHLHWRASIAGKTEEWDAEITDQRPDERIAWRSTSGAPNGGLVTFDKRGEGRTRVTLSVWYTPQGPVEQAGAALGVLARQVEADLRRFKEFIEARGQETGAWRGEVEQGTVQEDGAEAGTRARRTHRAREASAD